MIQVPTGNEVPTCDWVTDDWETKCNVQTPGADGYQENIVKTMHVSLGTDDTIDCSLALKAEELVEVVHDVTPTAYEKDNMDMAKINPVNGSTDDVIAVEMVVNEMKKELLLDVMAHPEHVPAREASLGVVLVPV